MENNQAIISLDRYQELTQIENMYKDLENKLYDGKNYIVSLKSKSYNYSEITIITNDEALALTIRANESLQKEIEFLKDKIEIYKNEIKALESNYKNKKTLFNKIFG